MTEPSPVAETPAAPPGAATAVSPRPPRLPQPASRHALLVASLLVLVALTASLHREVLFSGAVYHMDDAADNYYPARVAFARAVKKEGTLPSWEPNAMAGWPLLADPYYGYFYPLNFVFYLGGRASEPTVGDAAGVPAGLGYSAALHTLLAGIGMLFFLRRRVSPEAALFGAVAFLLSSFLVVRIRHIIYVQLVAWLPYFFLSIDHYLEKRRGLVYCALTTSVLLLVGAHSLLHFVVLLILGYVLARLLRAGLEAQKGERGRYLGITVLSLGAAAVCGAMLAALSLFPTLYAMPHSARALGTDAAFAATYAWPSFDFYTLLFVPDLLGKGEFRGQPFIGRWNHWELAGYYQGALAFFLALPGALLRHHGRRHAERLALFLLSLLAIGIAVGDAGPVHPFLFRHLPLYGALRCPARALVIVVVAAPILAAYGADILLAELRRLPARLAGRVGMLAGGGLAVLLVGGAYLLSVRYQQLAKAAPLARQLVLVARSHLVLVLGCGLAVLFLRWLARLPAATALLFLTVITAGDQLKIDRGYVQPKPIDYPAGTERFSSIEWLLEARKANTEPWRYVSDSRGPFRLLASGETLGMPAASGYGSVILWRYAHLIYILNNGRTYPYDKLRDDLAAVGIRRFDTPLLDALNVRYVIAFTDLPPRFVERFRPTQTPPAVQRHEPSWDPALRVFENTTVMPRAYVAYQARVASTELDEAKLVADPLFDPHREVIIGQPAAGSLPRSLPLPVPVENQARPQRPAQIVAAERHHVVIDAQAEAAGVLVLADAYHPDWQVKVDGQPATLLPANLGLRGVPISAGQHRVEFTYHDRALRRGAQVFALGLCGLVLLGVVPVVVRRRRRAAALPA